MKVWQKKIRDFFIPSLQNHLRPYSLRGSTVFFVLVAAFLLNLLFLPQVTAIFASELFRNVFVTLAIYIILALLIPIYVIFKRHQADNYWIRAKEISMLFRGPIRSSFLALSCLVVAIIVNYALARFGLVTLATAAAGGVKLLIGVV